MAIRKLDPETSTAKRSVAMKSDPARIDSKKLKLGKQTARHDPRTLLLATYTTPGLPPPPSTVRRSGRTSYTPTSCGTAAP